MIKNPIWSLRYRLDPGIRDSDTSGGPSRPSLLKFLGLVTRRAAVKRDARSLACGRCDNDIHNIIVNRAAAAGDWGVGFMIKV